MRTTIVEERMFITGQHRVADLECSRCQTWIGSKYEKAFEPSQRYKEGKCVIELAYIFKENRWGSPFNRKKQASHVSSPTSGYQSSSSSGQQNDAFFTEEDDADETCGSGGEHAPQTPPDSPTAQDLISAFDGTTNAATFPRNRVERHGQRIHPLLDAQIEFTQPLERDQLPVVGSCQTLN